MEPKKISPTQKAIQQRFFQAIVLLKEKGIIGGLKPFCLENNLNWKKYNTLSLAQRDPEKYNTYKLIDIEALAYLAKDYKVSSDWLLTGRGEMIKNN